MGYPPHRLASLAVSDPVEGIHADNVTKWFTAHVPEIATPLTFTLIAGGRSNLTFRVEDAEGRAWVLRRPPIHHVLPTAHDMVREHRLMTLARARRASRCPRPSACAPTRRSTSGRSS